MTNPLLNVLEALHKSTRRKNIEDDFAYENAELLANMIIVNNLPNPEISCHLNNGNEHKIFEFKWVVDGNNLCLSCKYDKFLASGSSLWEKISDPQQAFDLVLPHVRRA